MDIEITPTQLRFAIGSQQELVLNDIDDTALNSHTERVIIEVTTGIDPDFSNIEILRSIIITYLKYFFWTRMNTKDVPEHIREEKKAAAKLLSQIRSGSFRDSHASPSVTVKPQHFNVNL